MTLNTNQSLLRQAKLDPQSEAWFQMNSVYDPLITGWIARAGVVESDIGDIAQEVMQTLAQELVNFEHNGRTGAFRSWLKMITINRCRRYWDNRKKLHSTNTALNAESATTILDQLEDPNSDASLLWNKEHDQYVIEKVMQLIRREFDERDFDIFVRVTLKNESPKSISDRMKVTVGNIYKIKFRILQRLKEAAEGLLDPAATSHMDDA